MAVSYKGDNIKVAEYTGNSKYKDILYDALLEVQSGVSDLGKSVDISASDWSVASDAIVGDSGCVKSNYVSVSQLNNYMGVDGTYYSDNAIRAVPSTYGCQPLNTNGVVNVDYSKTTDNNKENNKMKNFNFDFGNCENNSNIRMSIYGLAVQNPAGDWVSYDKASGKIIDVDFLNIPNAGKYIFKVPCPVSGITEGDVIVHNRKPMFVCAVNKKGNKITAIDISAGEEKTILPTTSPFGFNFITKLVSMFNMANNGSANEQNPFGNMLPFLMFSGSKEIDPMMMMFMMGGQNGFANLFNFGNTCGCQDGEPDCEESK